jgi:hypothetical protein
VGGQRELRWHEPEWHVASVRPLHEPTRAHGGNSDADTNCKSNSNRNRYRHPDCNGHGNRHADCYRYANTHSNSENPSHTKAPSNTTASSVTRNTRLEKSNQAATDAKPRNDRISVSQGWLIRGEATARLSKQEGRKSGESEFF